MGLPKKGTEGVSRAERKAKKRKLEDTIPDLPTGDDNTPDDIAEEPSKKRKRSKNEDGDVEGEDETKKVKSAKKEKKEKKSKQADGDEEDVEKAAKKAAKKAKKDAKAEIEEEPVKEETVKDDAPRKSKKERKTERKALEAAAKKEAKVVEDSKPKSDAGAAEVNGDAETGEAAEKSKKNNRNREKKRKTALENGNKDEKKTADRFIVFIGNLPFTATTKTIEKHFAKLKPKSVRHLTHKDNPAKSKGSAFIEFDGYDHMKTCLKTMHHSMFDDGVSAPRKINVELTAGGGGNTKERRVKIEEKNQKLNEERARRAQEEAKAKLTKGEGSDEKKKVNEAGIDESAIHPSRRRNVPM